MTSGIKPRLKPFTKKKTIWFTRVTLCGFGEVGRVVILPTLYMQLTLPQDRFFHSLSLLPQKDNIAE